MTTGRRKPYTNAEIASIPCCRCGKPSRFQWQCCANLNRYLGLCKRCDIALNKLALDFLRIGGRTALMRAYRLKLNRDTP